MKRIIMQRNKKYILLQTNYPWASRSCAIPRYTDNRKNIHHTVDGNHIETKQINPICIPRRKLRRQKKPYKTRAWILHRCIRSELKYSSWFFQCKASNRKGSILFEENRNGQSNNINNFKVKDISVKIHRPNKEPESYIMPPLHEFQQWFK